MSAARSVILMIMIASLASGIFAVLLALFVGGSGMLVISIPGFVVGAFFAFKYATYDRAGAKEEEYKRDRKRRRH